MNDDMYRTCRWCKYYDNKTGTCINNRAFDEADKIEFYSFYEDGHLSEAIKEGFKEFKFNELETTLIGSKLSKKRVEKIMKVFHEELETAFVNWTESIDDSVSTALEKFDFDIKKGVSIKDPTEFSCKYFL